MFHYNKHVQYLNNIRSKTPTFYSLHFIKTGCYFTDDALLGSFFAKAKLGIVY